MTHHDALVVGGGPAGLSAAVTLARSLRRVLVIDAGAPRNAPAHAAHNVLGREGVSPLDLLAAGRAEAEAYGAEIVSDQVVAARRTDLGFDLELASGGRVTGRRLVLATGLVDELPDVPGVREFWGDRVLHCPYCHGYEVRGARIAVLASSPMAVHQALLFRQLSDDVTVLLHDQPAPGPEDAAHLAALGVPVVTGRVEGITALGDDRLAVNLGGDERLEAEAVVVGPRMVARGDLYEQLGGRLTDHPMGLFIEAGPMGRTPLDGVWAAGNVGNLSAMVTVASGEGLMAGAAINADLVHEEVRTAVAASALHEVP